MQSYHCPSCGAEVKFQSPISVTCVCPFCRSLIVRHDKDVEAMGKVAEVPDDISPFQIGTAGIYRSVHFGLIGRMRIGWEDGYWNEWSMFTDGGKKGWLEEAQGFLAVSFEQDMTDSLRHTFLAQPQLGSLVNLGDRVFSVADVKDTECIACEGELPFLAPTGQKSKVFDLISDSGDFASLEYNGDKGEMAFYRGEYVEFNQLHFTQLRDLPGWKMPLNSSVASRVNKPNG